MRRIQQCFQALHAEKKQALIPFVVAGDPQISVTVPLMHSLVEAGADILELGVPFTDPMAEGPVIQLASERALKNQVNLTDVLGMVKQFRVTDQQTPIVLMGYTNPIETMGYQTFSERAQEVGVDGVISVDLPLEESLVLNKHLQSHEIDLIFLLAPTTPKPRIAKICKVASGFIYYVSLKGVTGAGYLDIDDVAKHTSRIRQETQLPIAVGFGIKTPDDAASIAHIADAVVVGSALVSLVEKHQQDMQQILTQIPNLVSCMRQAMD